jgi:hypothetical protein
MLRAGQANSNRATAVIGEGGGAAGGSVTGRAAAGGRAERERGSGGGGSQARDRDRLAECKIRTSSEVFREASRPRRHLKVKDLTLPSHPKVKAFQLRVKDLIKALPKVKVYITVLIPTFHHRTRARFRFHCEKRVVLLLLFFFMCGSF